MSSAGDERFVEAAYSGPFNVDRILAVLGPAVEKARGSSHRRLLVDLSGVQGPLSMADRYELGVRGAALAGNLRKIALFAPPELIDQDKFGIRVARNRGATADIFPTREEAVAWLLSDD
jgi:hypothetical protein